MVWFVDFLWWMKRISIPEIKHHPWFLKNLAKETAKGKEEAEKENGRQSVEDIMKIIQEAGTTTVGQGSNGGGIVSGGGSLDGEDLQVDEESEVDVSGDYSEN